MPYSDGAVCHGCMYHATVDDSDCYHQPSTALTSMHSSWGATAPFVQVMGVAGGMMWACMGT